MSDNKSSSNKPVWKKVLYIFLWILLFPLPLTRIILKKEIKPVIKYSIITLAWILYMSLGAYAYSRPQAESTIKQPTTTEHVEPNEKTEPKEESKNEEISANANSNDNKDDDDELDVIYKYDKVINKFINDYNKVAAVPITKVEKGNINIKAYVHINQFYVKLANYEDAFEVNLDASTIKEVDLNNLFESSMQVAKILDPTLSENQIAEFKNYWESKQIEFDPIDLGNLKVTYTKGVADISDNRIWFNLESPSYAKLMQTK